MSKYRVEINKVENGYTVRIDNDNAASRVFTSFEALVHYITEFFGEAQEIKQ